MLGLGDLAGGSFLSQAYAVSTNGSVVVGNSSSTAGDQAFRWTQAGGMVGLGDLPGGFFVSYALDVSADGSVVVGLSQSGSGNEAFRWTQAGGMVGLGDLAGGTFYSQADGVSADGSVVIGAGTSGSGTEAFRWTQATGMVGLGDLPGGSFLSVAYGVSANGLAVVGMSRSGSGDEAFRWTQAGGMEGLGDLAGGGFASRAYGASGDGSLVVGYGTTASGQEAFIWDSVYGIRNLRDVLVNDFGMNLTGWQLLQASAISSNGLFIVGFGSNPSGQIEAWLADLSPPPGSPNPPTNLLVTPASANQNDLSWTDNSGNEDGFKIERAPDNGGVPGAWTQIATVGANVTTYNNTGLPAGVPYWYRVRAYNASGNSPYSTPATTPIAAPTNLAAAPLSTTQITLSWTDNASNEAGFKVERAPDASGVPGAWAQIGTVSRDTTSYTDGGLTTTATYWYRVRAYNGGGNSDYSTATSITVPAAANNSWTSANNGKWETPTDWSANMAPIITHSVFVTNGTTKTVTIDATTAATPGIMAVADLTLGSPNGSTNTLLLANTGLGAPLRVLNALTITNSILWITNSALESLRGSYPAAAINGLLRLDSGRFTATNDSTGILVGNGSVTVNGGTLLLGSSYIRGNVTVAGGDVGVVAPFSTLNIGDASATTSTGSVFVTGGRLGARFSIGFYSHGRLTVNSGTVTGDFDQYGLGYGSGGATLTVAGGLTTFTNGFNVGGNGSTGTVWITGGQLVTTNGIVTAGSGGVCSFTMSNGTYQATELDLSRNATFRLAGGTSVISVVALTGDFAGTGTVWMTSGQLLANKLIIASRFPGSAPSFFQRALMTISNGTAQAQDVIVGSNSFNHGTLVIAGGKLSAYSTLILGNCALTTTGIVTMTGGSLFVTNAAHTARIEVRNGTFTLNGGTLVADILVMTNSCGRFIRTGGAMAVTTVQLDPALDADGDGLPNGWEQKYRLDPLASTGADGADGDPDGDGLTNSREFLLGTDPTDKSSPYRITGIANEGQKFRITWMTVGGTTNILQVAPDPAGTYSNISPNVIIPGVSLTTTNHLDDGATNAPTRFYRVRLVP